MRSACDTASKFNWAKDFVTSKNVVSKFTLHLAKKNVVSKFTQHSTKKKRGQQIIVKCSKDFHLFKRGQQTFVDNILHPRK